MLTRDDAPPPMKLSTAIRLGAMATTKLSDGRFYFDGGACATGAALLAVGAFTPETASSCYFHIELARLWPWADTTHVQCPQCERVSQVRFIAAHLNNSVSFGGHNWTREAVADFVEGLEAAQAHGEPASCDAVRLSVEQPGVPLRV